MLRHMFSARRTHPRSVFSETVMPVRKKSVKSSSSPGTAVQHVPLPPLLIMFTNDIIIILPKHLLKPESTCPRLLLLLITSPPLHYRFCCLDCYCSADVMTLSVEKTWWAQIWKWKQHQWLLCQVLAESKPNSNLLSWPICLICHFPEC